MTDSAQPNTTTPFGLNKRLVALQEALAAARAKMGTVLVLDGRPAAVQGDYVNTAVLIALLQKAVEESGGTVEAAGLADIAEDVTIEQFADAEDKPRSLRRLAGQFQSRTGIHDNLVIPAILRDLDRELKVSEGIAEHLAETLSKIETAQPGDGEPITMAHPASQIAKRWNSLKRHGRNVGITFEESPGNDLPPKLEEALLFAFSRLNFVNNLFEHVGQLIETLKLGDESFDIDAAGQLVLEGFDEILGEGDGAKEAADKARAIISKSIAGAAILNAIWGALEIVTSVMREAEIYLTVVFDAHLVEEFSLRYHRLHGRLQHAATSLQAHLPLKNAPHSLQERVALAMSAAQSAETLFEQIAKMLNGIKALAGTDDDDDGGDLISALFGLARQLVSTLGEQVGIDQEVVIPTMAVDMDRNFAHVDELITSVESCVSELDERQPLE